MASPLAVVRGDRPTPPSWARKLDAKWFQQSHPVVERFHEEWQFYLDSYEGGKTYREGGHLFRYERESESRYNERVARAHYANYTSTVVDIPLGHLFKREIVRKSQPVSVNDTNTQLSDEYQRFIVDVDGLGTPMDEFVRQAMTQAMIFGWAPVFIDMPRVKRRIRNLADQKKAGLHPYLTLVNPLNVINWSSRGSFFPTRRTGGARSDQIATGPGIFAGHLGPLSGLGSFGTYGGYSSNYDATGNENPYDITPSTPFYKPDWFTYEEVSEDEERPFADRKRRPPRYRTWTKDWWFIHNEDGELIDWDRNIMGDELPMIIFYSKQSQRYPIIGVSWVADISYLNKAIFNYDSLVDEQIHEVVFPLLAQPEDQTFEEDVREIDVTMLWTFPSNARHPPQWMAPPAEPIDVIERKRAAVVREIFRIAKLSSVITTEKRVAESGLKSAFDFEETNQAIADLAAQAEHSEFEVARLWHKLMAPTADPQQVTVRYPRKFDILSISDEINQALTATVLKFPHEWWRLIKRSIGQKTLQRTSANNEEINQAMDAIMNQPEDTMDIPVLSERQVMDITDTAVQTKPRSPAAGT